MILICFDEENLLWKEEVDGRENKLKHEVDEKEGSPIDRPAKVPVSLT